MKWPSRKKPEPKKPLGLFAVEGKTSPGYLVASTEQQSSELNKMTSIRGRLEAAHLIEQSSTLNPALAVPITTFAAGGYTYPIDFYDYKDYLDTYYYIPYVARAVDIKHFMIWQMGYDLECEDKGALATLQKFLVDHEVDLVLREGSLYALVYGNIYWHLEPDGSLQPLNPARVGVKLALGTNEVLEYRYEPVFGKIFTFKPEEILHLRFNPEPWGVYGTSCLKRVLPTVKALVFMEEKLPLIARRRADPLLAIQIGDKDNPVDEQKFKQIKGEIINRNPGEDIFHDGLLKIQEVYQSASVGGRQTVEPIIDHFVRNLVAGLGVPEPALGFGGTTTMATAEYQERVLEAETRNYQRILNKFFEGVIFPLAKVTKPVSLNWKPLTEEDKTALSKMFQGDIEHGIVSPEWARRRLGYPEVAGKGTVMSTRLQAWALPAIGQPPTTASPNPESKQRMEAYEKIVALLDKIANGS